MQKIFTLFAAAIVAVTMNAATYNGNCGANAKWSLDTSTGVLTVSGSGAMYDKAAPSEWDWYQYRGNVKTIKFASGSSITYVGAYAFSQFANVSSIDLPNTVSSIGKYAFSGSGVKNVTLPTSVTVIGESAFNGCSSLYAVRIPSSVKTIGDGAFNFCYKLESVYNFATTPQTLTDDIFYDVNTENYKVFVPEQSLSAYSSAAYWKDAPLEAMPTCGDDLTWVFLDGTGVLIIDGTGEMYDYKKVSNIPWYGILKDIKQVSLPDGLTSIGECAFFYCTNLTSVAIPESVTSIKEQAFYHCEALTSITIPESVTSIGVGAFYVCKALTSITIPKSVTSIGSATFSSCTSLTAIDVDAANPNYSSVDGVLFNKDKTTLISYPAGNPRTSYTIPNTVKKIVIYAFTYSQALTSVTIPESVTSIEMLVFNLCTSLTAINVDAANPNYSSEDGVLFNKDKTTLISYPAGNPRTSYTIPNTVTEIMEYAFGGCGTLSSVTIPESVTVINEGAFSYCYSLAEITNYATTPQSLGYWVFDEVNKAQCTLYVPAESVDLYQETATWKEFDIEAINEEQGVEKVQGDQVPGTKVLRNGMLLIERNGKTYNAQGVEIQ